MNINVYRKIHMAIKPTFSEYLRDNQVSLPIGVKGESVLKIDEVKKLKGIIVKNRDLVFDYFPNGEKISYVKSIVVKKQLLQRKLIAHKATSSLPNISDSFFYDKKEKVYLVSL